MFNPATLATVLEKARQNATARSMSSVKAVKPPAGESRWRLLPGWRPNDRETFFHSFGRHWIKNPNDLDKPPAVYICERETYGKACAICDAIGEGIRSTKDDQVLSHLKDMNAERGVLLNAVQIPMVGGKADLSKVDPTKVTLLSLTPSLFERNLLPLISSRWAEEINMLSLEDGRDIIIRKEGAGLMTRYSIADASKNTAIDPEVMNHLVDIDAWLVAERSRGEMRGIEPFNERLRSLMGSLGPSSGTASLIGAHPLAGGPAVAPAAAAAALAPVHRVLDDSDVVEIEREAARAARPKSAPVESAADDEDLDKLLADLK